MTGFGCRIRGTGSSFGSRVVDSAVIEERLNAPAGWCADRTGIRTRFHAADGERTTDLAVRAAELALADARLAPSDLGMVICATMTSEMCCPAAAHRLIERIGATPCGGFDLTSACAGYLSAMQLAADTIRVGTHEHVLVVGSDVLSPTVDPDDPKVAGLFGDGAGATVLSRDPNPEVGCVAQLIGSDGGQWDAVYHPRIPADLPTGIPAPPQFDRLIMNGLAVYRFATSKMIEIIPEVLGRVGLTHQDADMILLHQSNLRIINNVRLEFGWNAEKCPSIIETTGNTSGGSVGVLLDAQRRAGRIRPGMTLAMAALGGGLSWAASVWRV
ncbi:MAG: ketoacyl-ACP synthase III [Gemmataceae bacterium]|nr:ketoacyl-ACP synthase III [Gemmataceae bacterium]